MPYTRCGGFFEGFVKVSGRRYFVSARDPGSSSRHLVVDRRLYNLLDGAVDEFLERSKGIEDVGRLFESFEGFITKALESKSIGKGVEPWSSSPMKVYHLYKYLDEELQGVGEYVKDVDFDEGVIRIEAMDSAFRVHKAALKFTDKYPKEPIKVTSHDLPILNGNFLESNINLDSINTLTGFCKRFVLCIDRFQDFWNCVSILDSNCWILDPENPTYKDVTRRIKISDKISVLLFFNPYACGYRPDIKFLGCHSSVAEFRAVLQKNLENDVWDPEEDILANLTNLLEVTFPAKTEDGEEDTLDMVKSGECAICFLVRLDDEITNEICDNVNCMSSYHSTCLFKYLSSVPNNKNFFGRIQGKCPNCDEVISCAVPNTAKLF